MTQSSTMALIDTLAACRRVRDHHAGHIPETWGTCQQMLVAVVLDNTAHLAALGYTPDQARDALINLPIAPPDLDTWLATIRAELEALTELDTTLTNLATALGQDTDRDGS